MGKVLYSYNVFDMQESKYIIKNEPLSKVVEVTGLPKDKVCQYAEHGYIHNGRYQVARNRLDDTQQDIDLDSKKRVNADFKAKWDDMLELFKPFKKKTGAVK